MDEKVDLEASLPLPTTANQSIGIKDTIASEAITTSKQTSSVKWDKLIRVAGISILVWLAYNSLIPTSESLKHDKTSEIDPYFAGLKAKEFEFASVSPFTTGVSGNGDDDTLAVRYGSGRQGGKTLNVNQEQDEEEGSDSDSDGDDDTEDTNRDEKNIKGKHDKHGKHGKHGKHDKHGHRHPHQRVPPKKAEEIFLSVPSNDSVAAASYRYTKNEHMAGTGNGHLSAINLKAEYEAHLGLPFSAPYENVFDAGTPENQHAVLSLADTDREAQPKVWVDTYFPVMNKPVFRSVDILVPDGNGLVEWSAKLREDIVEGDPTSIYRDEVPTFHGLSVSGNVTGPILYAGYGSKQDFEALEAAGIDVTGSIILVKYGKVFRGLKIKAAQEAGAIGCLIYSDPGDDGEITLKNGYEAYPAGPARQPSSVQRGSVQFISSYPGVWHLFPYSLHAHRSAAHRDHRFFRSQVIRQRKVTHPMKTQPGPLPRTSPVSLLFPSATKTLFLSYSPWSVMESLPVKLERTGSVDLISPTTLDPLRSRSSSSMRSIRKLPRLITCSRSFPERFVMRLSSLEITVMLGCWVDPIQGECRPLIVSQYLSGGAY